ncbi:hypothetical protein [Thiomicrorhabdus sp.]|uniref:hypothetical protein n=1 Tax=Thiomicrorhabdus sp. TaxID=2039724 RepID=UPI0029C87E8E|nr:hypothetical protein [Thiomicrorhabdus sp.]
MTNKLMLREIIGNITFKAEITPSNTLLYRLRNGCLNITGSDIKAEWSDGKKTSLDLYQGSTKIVLGFLTDNQVIEFEDFKELSSIAYQKYISQLSNYQSSLIGDIEEEALQIVEGE